MKFKVGDKIQYRDFLVNRNPNLAGTFTVDRAEEGHHEGCNRIASADLSTDHLVCSSDFELADKFDETFRLWDTVSSKLEKY